MIAADSYIADLTQFSNTLKQGVRQLVSSVKTEENSGAAAPAVDTNKQTLSPKVGKIVVGAGLCLSVAGFACLGNIVGIVGIAVAGFGVYMSRPRVTQVSQSQPIPANSLKEVADNLYDNLESLYKKDSKAWDDFIESQRLKINLAIKGEGLDLTTQTRLIDSQVSNSVLSFNVMTELGALNSIGRSGDWAKLEAYLPDFVARYVAAIDKAVDQQIEIYERLKAAGQ